MQIKLRESLRIIGPGFIMASVVLGPGSITVASRIGSEHGYSFLWVIVLAAVFMMVYASMGTRFGVVSKKSVLEVISVSYGRWFAVLIGLSTFLSTSSFQFGNNLGIGIGMQGITGIDERVWPLIFTPVALLLLFWAKNLYKVLEKLMMAIVMIMIVAFMVNLVLTKPNLVSVGMGFIPRAFSIGQVEVIVALMATSFALSAAIYQAYLAQDKGWKKEQLSRGLKDTFAGIAFLSTISAIIIITSATALKPRGIVVSSAADMAQQMDALFGGVSKIIFSLGLCAAAFSSLMVNAVIGGGLLSDSLGLGRSMNEKMPKIFTAIILLLGMFVAIFFRGNVIYALVMAQASSMMAVPAIAIGLLLVANQRKLMGTHRNTLLQNAIAIIGLLCIMVMIYFMYQKLVQFFNVL